MIAVLIVLVSHALIGIGGAISFFAWLYALISGVIWLARSLSRTSNKSRPLLKAAIVILLYIVGLMMRPS